MEITGNIIVCINLLDEAKKKGIEIDTEDVYKRQSYYFKRFQRKIYRSAVFSKLSLFIFEKVGQVHIVKHFFIYCLMGSASALR